MKTKSIILIKHAKDSKAVFVFLKKYNGKWKKVFKTKCYIGKNGIGKLKEGDMKTPLGIFRLKKAFGIRKNINKNLEYIPLNENIYACTDKDYYNNIIDISKVNHKCNGEKMIEYLPLYNAGIQISYNDKCIYGKGSNIFIHCIGKNKYTAGCIAIKEKYMMKLLNEVDTNTIVMII